MSFFLHISDSHMEHELGYLFWRGASVDVSAGPALFLESLRVSRRADK